MVHVNAFKTVASKSPAWQFWTLWKPSDVNTRVEDGDHTIVSYEEL